MESLRSFFIGLFVWIINIFFGAILLDILYSSLIIPRITDTTELFAKVSDFLLGIGIVVIVAALVAIIFSWKLKIARNLFIVSLLIFIFEFLTPVIFGQLKVTQEFSWIRIVINGLASIIASIGLYYFYLHRKV